MILPVNHVIEHQLLGFHPLNLCNNAMLSFLVRCAVNATPEKMPDAAVQLERFLCSIASNKKERKSVRAVIFEVSNQTYLFESGFPF